MKRKHVRVWVIDRPDRKMLSIEWRDRNGVRHSQSTGTTDRAEAQRQADRLAYELNYGRLMHATDVLTWEAFRARYEAEHVSGLRPSTQDKIEDVLNLFEEFRQIPSIVDIDETWLSEFAAWMRREGYEPPTIKSYLASLRACLHWAMRMKCLDAVPTMPTVRVPKRAPKAVPVDVAERLMEAAPDARWRAFFGLAWWAGMRIGESMRMRWTPSEKHPYVDLVARRIVLPAAFAKAGADQWVPIHPRLAEALEALPRCGDRLFEFTSSTGRRMSRASLSGRVTVMARRAGVCISYHDLRRGFGSRLAQVRGQAPSRKPLPAKSDSDYLCAQIIFWNLRSSHDIVCAHSTHFLTLSC